MLPPHMGNLRGGLVTVKRILLASLGFSVGGFLLMWCGIADKAPSLSTIGTVLGLILLIVSLHLVSSIA